MKRLMAVLGIILMVLCLRSGPNVQLTGYHDTVDQRAVPLVRCGVMGGSGVAVGPHTIITAHHVVGQEPDCDVMLAGWPRRAVVVSSDPVNDVAVLRVATTLPVSYPVSCGGIVSGQTYFAAGYPNSLDYRVETYVGTAQYFIAQGPNGDTWTFRALNGLAVEGMSGGPVLTLDHHVVAIINARPLVGKLALVKELRDTQICTGAPTDK